MSKVNSMTVDDMVAAMIDETECRAELREVRSNLWRTQFRDAFKYPGGPDTYWEHIEKQWKEVTDGAPIPAKYRSNKSVIIKAHAHAPVLAEWVSDGVVLGKTRIESLCKDRAGRDYTSEIIRIIGAQHAQMGPAEVTTTLHSVNEWAKANMGVMI